VDERAFLAEQFEEKRATCEGWPTGMLGSQTEADDAVQEAWLKVSRSGNAGVENLGGWLTTIVARVCLDILRSRKARREEALGANEPEPIDGRDERTGPEQDALLADSVGLALLIRARDACAAERVAFVLHDMFDLSFDEIAPIVGRSAEATRQLASRARVVSRARRRLPTPTSRVNALSWMPSSRHRAMAISTPCSRSSIRTSCSGPTVRPSREARRTLAHRGWRRRFAVRRRSPRPFSGRAQAAQPALLDGMPGAVWAPGGTPRVAFAFTIGDGRIVRIEIVADPETCPSAGGHHPQRVNRRIMRPIEHDDHPCARRGGSSRRRL